MKKIERSKTGNLMMTSLRSQKFVSVLALFTSTGTLLCCALPVAVAALAGGASIVALTGAFPWLIPLSSHKGWIFIGAGLMLAFNGILMFRPHGKVACAITGGEGCELAGRFTKMTFWISIAIISVGAFFAYLIVPMLRLLEDQ